MKKTSFSLWLFIVTKLLWAQEVPYGGSKIDSSLIKEKSYTISFFRADDYNGDTIVLSKQTNELDGFQLYNPLFKDYKQAASLGAYGSPSYSLCFNYQAFSPFSIGWNQFNPYRKNYDVQQFYKVNIPYSKLYFVSGGANKDKTQNLGVELTRNLSPSFNFSFKFNQYGSDGWFSSQKNSNRVISLTTFFNPKDGNYRLLSALLLNQNSNQENGGLADTSILTNFPAFGKSAQVNMSQATTTASANGLWLKGYYNLGSKTKIVHENAATKHKFKYNQPSIDKDYYNNINFDTLKTIDSTGIWELINTISLQHRLKPNAWIQMGVTHQYDLLADFSAFNGIDTAILPLFGNTYLQNLALTARVNYSTLSNKISYKGMLIKSVWGNNVAALNFTNSINFDLGYNMQVATHLTISQQPASLVQQRYLSNHFSWSNNFLPQQRSSLGIDWSFKSNSFYSSLNLQVANINHHIYYDSTAHPAQATSNVRLAQATALIKYQWRWLAMVNRTTFQQTNNTAILPLPKLVTYQSIYFKHTFKKDWQLQSGLDFTYFSPFYALAWMPATNQFYLQNKLKTVTQVRADIFAMVMVRKTKLFVKYEQANQLQNYETNFNSYFYPLGASVIRFGIDWSFYN